MVRLLIAAGANLDARIYVRTCVDSERGLCFPPRESPLCSLATPPPFTELLLLTKLLLLLCSSLPRGSTPSPRAATT